MTVTEQDALALERRLVELTRELVLIPGTVNRPEDRRRCMRFIRYHLEANGPVEIREYEDGGYTSLLALAVGVEEPEVLLCGHLDVVALSEEAVYDASIEGGRIVGPGAADMKGPLAILIDLFLTLLGEDATRSLGLLITSDEEQGGEHGVRHLLQDRGLRCGLALIPDGGSPGEITVEEKGILQIHVESRGESAHAARPWLAQNALELFMQGYQVLQERLQALEGEGHWRPTVAVTRMDTPNQSMNCIPDRAHAGLDLRYPGPWTAGELMDICREAFGDAHLVTPAIIADPTRLNPDPRFIELAEEAYGHPVLRARESGGSDARFFHRLGIPVIMTRPLMGHIHSAREWIDIGSMVTFYGICRQYLCERLSG